jgi:tetratricopeptide (TPR) repeat protein
MASVFLSYDREDADRARTIALAIEKAGHSVWWDRHIKGGAQYSDEIEQALGKADAVIVLWSERAIHSAWVRDEAAAGRDSGRLVPVSIDGASPPLGFRQYQTIDIAGWKGGKQVPKLPEVLHAIESIAGGPGTGAEVPISHRPLSKVRQRFPFPLRWSMVGLAVVVAAAVAALIFWNPFTPNASTTVAVYPADSSPASRDLARDLLAKLGTLESVGGNPVEIISASQRKRADLLFEVASSTEARRTRANIVLIQGHNGSLLWSKDFERPVVQSGDLRQQLAYTAAQVLECALEAYPRGRTILKTDVLKLYLKGCAGLAGAEGKSVSDLIPLLRQVTVAAPRFESAWSQLLIAEEDAYVRTENPRLRAQLEQDIAAARALDRDMAAAYATEIDLLPMSAYTERLNLADRAITANRDDPLLPSIRSGILFSVGRLNDAINDAQRAARLNPLSPRLRETSIGTLADSGRMEAALAELAEAERLWPDSSSLDAVKFRINLRYGDPRIARQIVRSGELSAGWIEAESFLQARIDPTPENIERAINNARSIYERYPGTFQSLVQTLSIFNREPDLLSLLMRVPLEDAISVTDVMFRPAAREFWRDPRSLSYANRAGLLQYWRTSGKWPDFCFEPGLPYDCKKEAAKLVPGRL